MPRRLVILGGGTAGTMAANRLRRELPDWDIVVVDRDNEHHYQPGYLFLPFGTYERDDLVRPRVRFLPDDVRLDYGDVDHVDTDSSTVHLVDGRTMPYDQLIIATGTHPTPEETPGMLGSGWNRDVFDLYSLDGAAALADALATWQGGRLVVHVCELPIKCPVAPLEFAFLADSHLRETGRRDQTELVYVTPLDGAFTKPVASRELGGRLEERAIHLEADFMVDTIDEDRKVLTSFDDREVAYDLLVTVPVNRGAAFVGRSGLGDELDHVKVDSATMQSTTADNVFAIGDAANLPTSKAGSVAHFAVDVFVDNFVDHVNGRPMHREFDGHANCFIETGDNKAMMIDFNYDTQPLPGQYPLPRVGPFQLLKESRVNHMGKLAFRWVYWNLLLPGRPMPLSSDMSMRGKIPEKEHAA
ncbi:MAG TPA: FAD/NAD(P)-binding oxidoreductase [Nitriliruptoraceae bacterium]|nr:FAD/NAD(P)-binding oxidoreductase [Nitriliruptoraceae bacterium]